MAAHKPTPTGPQAPYSFHVLRPGPWRGIEDFWDRYLTSAHIWADSQGDALTQLINAAEAEYGLLIEILPLFGPLLNPTE